MKNNIYASDSKLFKKLNNDIQIKVGQVVLCYVQNSQYDAWINNSKTNWPT